MFVVTTAPERQPYRSQDAAAAQQTPEYWDIVYFRRNSGGAPTNAEAQRIIDDLTRNGAEAAYCAHLWEGSEPFASVLCRNGSNARAYLNQSGYQVGRTFYASDTPGQLANWARGRYEGIGNVDAESWRWACQFATAINDVSERVIAGAEKPSLAELCRVCQINEGDNHWATFVTYACFSRVVVPVQTELGPDAYIRGLRCGLYTPKEEETTKAMWALWSRARPRPAAGLSDRAADLLVRLREKERQDAARK
jgi:hypothetical protein